MLRSSSSPVKAYGAAILSTGVALLLSLLLHSLINRSTLVFFMGAVVFTASYGGLWPSLLATFLSAVCIDIFVLTPIGDPSTATSDLVLLAAFALTAYFVSSLYNRRARSEQVAYEQSEALRITLKSIGDAVITTDPKGIVTYLNPAAEVLTGWTQTDANGKDILIVFQIVNQETRQPVDNPIFKVLEKGATFGLANHTLLIAKGGLEYAIEDSAAPIRNVQGAVTGVVLTFHDVSERRQAELARQLLIDVTDQLITFRIDNLSFAQVAALLIVNLADWCEIDLLENGQLRRQVLIHHDSSRQPLLVRFYAQLPEAWNTAQQSIQSKETILDTTVSDRWLASPEISPDLQQMVNDLAVRSQLYVPLIVNDQVLGVIGLNRSAGRTQFAQPEVILAEEIALRLAIVLDNLRLTQQTTIAQRNEMRTAGYIARLQAITADLGKALLPIQVAETIVKQVIPGVEGAYGSLIALIDPKTRTHSVIYSAGYRPDQPGITGSISLDADVPGSDVLRRNSPLFIETPEDWLSHYPRTVPLVTSQSLAMLPLQVEGQPIGYLAVSFNQRQRFTVEERAFLNSVADQCAQAMHRTQLYAAEKQAREQIDTILESITDGFVSFDHELRYTYVNRQQQQMLNLPYEQIIGHTVEELAPGTDPLSDVFYMNARVALGENRTVEYTRESVALKRWITVRLYPFRGGLIAFTQDISARKLAEATAERNAQRMEAFVKSGVIGIIFATDEGGIIDANDKFLNMIGYTRVEMEAGTIDWIRLTPPEYAPLDQAAIADANRNPSGESNAPFTPFEKEYYHKDGRRIPVLIGGTRVQGVWISFVLDLTERKRAEARLRALTEASAILSASLDYRTTLNSVALTVVPAVADWCTIHLIDLDGVLRRVGLAHKDPAKVAWGIQIQQEYPDDPNATTGLYQVVRSGQPEIYPDIPDELLVAAAKGDEKLLKLLREIGYSSLMVVPLKIQDRVVGAIQLVATESRVRYTIDDLTLAEDLARRIAIAIDNARLYSEIQQERERWQVTLSSVGDAVISTDTHGNVVFINAVAQDLTGWTQTEAAGHPLEEVFNIVNEMTQRVVESPVTRVLREGIVVSLANHTTLITKTGGSIPIDDSAAPIRDSADNLIGVILVFRDIRQRRQTEQRLESTLQRTVDLYNTSRQISIANTPAEILEAVLTSRYLQAIQQAVIVVFNTPWQDIQPESYTLFAGLADAPLPGFADNQGVADSPLFEMFSGHHSIFIPDISADPSLSASFQEMLIAHQISSLILFPLWTAEACFGLLALFNSEPNHWTEEDFQHIRIFADQVAIVMESIRLFDSEKLARQEAERANELKIKFLAMISHELRTPLASIKGFTTSLLATDVTWDEASQREFIGIINEESDKLTDLISQLLDLSQLQAGTMRIQPEAYSIYEIVESATVQLIALTQRHKLSIKLPPDLPHVMADPRRIAEVITNLVGNAAKYTPEGTTIVVNAVRQENMVRVEVCDEGPGIPVESRELVFEAFRQLERKSDKPIKGAGLGLAICKGLIEAHHGQIWVADTAIGTTICFTLPIVEG